LPSHSVFFGEVSLAGEVRPVAHSSLRLKESAKLGFKSSQSPTDPGQSVPGMRQHAVTHLSALVDRILGEA
jgi:DNA repair protein RadA/Sms